MAPDESRVYAGAFYSIEWGRGPSGNCQAREYYYAMSEAERAKALMKAWLAQEASNERKQE